MTLVPVPSLAEIGAGIGLVSEGACDMASGAVQNFVNSPSVAETGLNLLASQIDVLEQLVAKLQEVGTGIEQVHEKLSATVQLEWHSPAGNAFRDAVGTRQEHARQLQETSVQTATLARQGIDELRVMISSLQSLLAAARTAAGVSAGAAVAKVCS